MSVEAGSKSTWNDIGKCDADQCGSRALTEAESDPPNLFHRMNTQCEAGMQPGGHPAACKEERSRRKRIETSSGMTSQPEELNRDYEEGGDAMTGGCIENCLPHLHGDQAKRFLKATAPDEPHEGEDCGCQWEAWAAKIDNRQLPSIGLRNKSKNEKSEMEQNLSRDLAGDGEGTFAVFTHPYLTGQPREHPYIQPLDLSDAASEGESKSKACLAGLSRGMCVCCI